jgi:hypothetical protein
MVQFPAMRPSIRRVAMSRLASRRSWVTSLLLLCGIVISACATQSPLTPIGEGPLGSVSLERLTSRGSTAKFSGPSNAFQASHPVSLSASLMSGVLGGLTISGVDRPERTAEQTSYPLFSPEEVEFLSPLTVRAFAQAQPDQRFRFVIQEDGLRTEGSIYLHKTTLRLSLSRYRSAIPGADVRQVPLALSFSPAQALATTDTPQSWMNIEPHEPGVAIAVDALGPSAAPMPDRAGIGASAAGGSTVSTATAEQQRLEQELRATKDLVVKQAEELQRVKEEMESMRRQLAEKDPAAVKAKPKTVPRKPVIQP